MEKEKDKKTLEEKIEEENISSQVKYGLDEEIIVKDEKIDEYEEKAHEIELRLQELDVLMDKAEIKLELDDSDIDAIEEMEKLKEERKKLLKEKKNLRKEEKEITYNPEVKSLDNLSVWIIIYGTATSLLCSPLLSNLWIEFAKVIITLGEDTVGAMDASTVLGKIVMILIVFALPLLLHIISWILYLNVVKTKTDKFAFKIAWLSQALFTLITMIIAIVNVVKG